MYREKGNRELSEFFYRFDLADRAERGWDSIVSDTTPEEITAFDQAVNLLHKENAVEIRVVELYQRLLRCGVNKLLLGKLMSHCVAGSMEHWSSWNYSTWHRGTSQCGGEERSGARQGGVEAQNTYNTEVDVMIY